MSLPEKPLTRRELYLAKAAGQDVTMPEEDLTREETYLRAIAEGGGGGGVTPEYVAEAIAEAKTDIEAEIPTKTSELTNDSGYAAIDDTAAAQDKAYSSAKVEEKVVGEEITTTATGTDLTLSTSSGNLNALTVYGKSEVVDGAIKSAGEGYAVVRLADLTWSYDSNYQYFYTNVIGIHTVLEPDNVQRIVSNKYNYGGYNIAVSTMQTAPNKTMYQRVYDYNYIYIKDTDYTTAENFVASLGDATLAYQLADSTQGNAIAVKTDNGTGIDGTMAVFETGTPLRGIPDSEVRDVMAWDGSAGTVTKVCGEVDLGTLNWSYYNSGIFYTQDLTQAKPLSLNCICEKYKTQVVPLTNPTDKTIYIASSGVNPVIRICDKTYSDSTAFKTAMNGVKLIYELATPTTEQLTTTENASIAGLRTFEPQTHAQNNAGATMTVKAYAGTANGKAVNELKQDVQSEISTLKITQSSTLTLTVADWSSNQQTVTYAHDTAKRNVIDVDAASVEEWASCGILATAETATGITFICKTVPENALTFRVTSMGV